MTRKRLLGIGRGVALAVIVIGFAVPLIWMVLAAFKSSLDITDPTKTLIFTPTLDNFRTVFGQQNFLPFIGNSLVVGALSTLLSLLLGVPAAYAMSRFRMGGSAGVVLLARIIPGVSLLVPWFYVFANLRLVGNYSALVLSHMFVTLPLIVWIMIGYYDQIPEELEESAQVDGLTPLAAFARITLPLSTPGIATASILAFIFSWNNFMFALVLSGENTRTLPVAIFNFIAYASIDWGGLMAASVIITVPIMIIALFTQRYIVAGMTAGATKG
ncbi:carbohydrate ABC transporter permease [Microlunatus parietis]|uniref:Multiple sugar transport system permease protein n=1 Tax=Microlunatus parietis TaxID=682979 RepID=A0A7Y9LC23_9ACTN|nr:carbohydrate ABC transporter permease [Microlunatus parietis]NYE72362.1 multiple sugar transport system permease protein [Microlunatus parietis]